MSELYKDIIPANANIEIEYGKESKVKFSYPINWTYRKAVLHRAFPTILTFFMLAFMKLLSFILWAFILPLWIYVLVIKNIDIALYNETTNAIIQIATFLFNHSDLIVDILGIFFLFSFMFPFILALNKNLLSVVMPKAGYYSTVLIGKSKEKIFITKDMENNRCIIPNFKNIFLNYKATEDFGKYLKKVKILSYDFKFHIRLRFGFFFHHSKKNNDLIYYAVFEFTEKPLNGYLECKYY